MKIVPARRNRVCAFIAVLSLALSTLVCAPAMSLTPSQQANQPVDARLQTPGAMRPVYYDLSHPVSLADAIRASKSVNGQVVGYRYSGPGIVGEYFPSHRNPTRTFLAEFSAKHGGAPAIKQIITAEPAEGKTLSRSHGRAPQRRTLSVESYAVAVPQPIKPEPELAAPSRGPVLQDRLPDHNPVWYPDDLSLTLNDMRDSRKVGMSMSWIRNPGSVHDPSLTPDFYGIMMRLHQVNEDIQRRDGNGVRNGGAWECSATNDFRNQFFAKAEYKSWYVSLDSNQDGSEIGAFVDQYDTGDPCWRQDISVGIAFPRFIKPASNAFTRVSFSANVYNGAQAVSRIESTVDAVAGHWCFRDLPGEYTPANYLPTGDCMGAPGSPAFPTVNGPQELRWLTDAGASEYLDATRMSRVYTTPDGILNRNGSFGGKIVWQHDFFTPSNNGYANGHAPYRY